MRMQLAAVTTLALCALTAMPACSGYRDSRASGERERVTLRDRAQEAVQIFRDTDPTMGEFFDSSVGYAVFPRVAKGAAGIGAANGNGVVYTQDGALLGFAELTQINIGFQLGGQSFRQIIFFQDGRALERFKDGDLEFSANASAVAATNGAAATNDYENGVAVFTMPRGGLMFEASIGGQGFDYVGVND